VDHYEQLRTAALSGRADGGGHGLALLSTRGMAAWIGAWRLLCPVPAGALPVRPPPARPDPVSTGGGAGGEGMAGEVVAVLAAMAAACLGR
jgi:hypothetical protein